MSDGLFSTLDLSAQPGVSRAGYRLQQVELFNWGTFDGRVWRLSPQGDNGLLTGDIGSGKSTVVDAVTTLLMPAHRISYNKAAGADSRERTLRSYVEGHYKTERNEATGASRPVGLRQGGGTYSVILGVFSNDGYDETVTLAQVFQQRDTTGQPYRFFVTATKALSVEADFSDFGSALPDLRKRLKAGGAEVFDDFPKYSVSLRRLLGIRSDQALELFHQTVSMKSVGNLNDFVRDHMLEPADAGDKVRGIIAHFEDLTKAHQLVTRARQQLEALIPIVTTAAKYDTSLGERAALETQHSAVRLFIAELRAQLLSEEIASHQATRQQLTQEKAAAEDQARTLAGERERLIEERARAGGDRIGELERLAAEARSQAEQRRSRRQRFDSAIADAGLPAVNTAADLAALRTRIDQLRPSLAEAKRSQDDRVASLHRDSGELSTRQQTILAELTSLEHRTSNLPMSHTDLREQLCADLGLGIEDLPYAGELLDVREDRAEWRGAAERVLRGFALSLLVPHEHYEQVAGWVNSHRLTYRGRNGATVGAKLVYERVPERRVRLQREPGAGLLLADCVEARSGRFEDYLVDELTRRADHRCVDTLAQFRTERRSVTREGQVRSGERHEKDDRSRVDDPRTWVLGWSNERKINALRIEAAEVSQALEGLASSLESADRDRDALNARVAALARLADYDSWVEIDHEEAAGRATEHDAERNRLEAGSSRLVELTRALARNQSNAEEVAATLAHLTGRLATTDVEAERCRRGQERDHNFISSQSAAVVDAARASYDQLSARLGKRRQPARAEDCAAAGDFLADDLHKKIEHLGREIGGLTTALVGAMNSFLTRWPELRADFDAHQDAREEFVAFHAKVASDDLPRFETEFKRQLNTNTIRELASFNAWLRRQADEIHQRVARINEALGAIDYNPGRHIRLQAEPTTNHDVRTFRTDLRQATDDALTPEDDHYSEQRFLEVQRIIERFRGREGYAEADKTWTRRVTDVRNWFTFSASERDNDTDHEWEHYTDSDGKSGGQKEKLAYTILAASLAYQFGLEWGVQRSRDFRFATIDEAFGRGSDASTRYALDLFGKLGLQLLIVTPLQKVHIIEPYVRSIGFVDNQDGTSSRLHMLTIEEFHELRDRP